MPRVHPMCKVQLTYGPRQYSAYKNADHKNRLQFEESHAKLALRIRPCLPHSLRLVPCLVCDQQSKQVSNFSQHRKTADSSIERHASRVTSLQSQSSKLRDFCRQPPHRLEQFLVIRRHHTDIGDGSYERQFVRLAHRPFLRKRSIFHVRPDMLGRAQ